jgi:hypothetical protein
MVTIYTGYPNNLQVMYLVFVGFVWYVNSGYFLKQH